MNKSILLVVLVNVGNVYLDDASEMQRQCRNVTYNVQHLQQIYRGWQIDSKALEDIKSQFAALQSKIQTQENKMQLQENKIKILQSEVKSLSKTAVRKAFHAEGSQKDILDDSIVKFANVKINKNGGYNASTSKFTCSDRGLYLFYVTISSYLHDGYGAVWYNIVQDGHIKAYGHTGYGSGAASTYFAMIRCNPGSQIWVKQAHDSSWKQGMWEVHSQFGGFEIAFN